MIQEDPGTSPSKVYEPGFVHIDIKHLPQMPDEEQKRYLYVRHAVGLSRGQTKPVSEGSAGVHEAGVGEVSFHEPDGTHRQR